jgi:dipeptidyl aminopeptidase/acylaminoacyl peptidase
LGGASSRSASLDELAPLRGAGGWSWTRRLGLPGIPMSVDAFGPAFGDDRETREDASPVNHVRPDLPPFLILSAENDLPTLPAMAQEFQAALLDQGCEARLFTVKDRNHNSIIFRAIEPQDPVAHAMLEFIREHAPCGANR